jgi:hypothetical protein
MSKKIFITISFVLLAFLSFAQKGSGLSTTAAASTQTTEAKNFGLTLINAFFIRDCNYVYSKLSSEITVFDGGTKVNKSDFSAQDICNEISIRTDITANYNTYLSNYEPEVLTAAEFGAKYPAYQTVLQLREGDFYFGGNKTRTGAAELFLSHDHTRFVLRRTGVNAFQVISF